MPLNFVIYLPGCHFGKALAAEAAFPARRYISMLLAGEMNLGAVAGFDIAREAGEFSAAFLAFACGIR